MEIDIRNSSYENVIDAIRFSKTDFLADNEENQQGTFRVYDEDNGLDNFIVLYKKDIDNFIKALQKAKELWT